MAAAMARRALTRQALQSLTAVGLTTLALLVLAPLALLVRAILALSDELQLPFGEPMVLAAAILVGVVTTEELVSGIIRRKLRMKLLAGVVAVQLAAWTVVVLVAKRFGVAKLGIASIPIHVLIYLVSRLVAVILTPGQSCGDRLRRTLRELKLAVARATSMSMGFTVVFYVYMTVFTQLDATTEVLVMGLGVPLFQTTCMMLLARTVRRQERVMRRRNAPSRAKTRPEQPPPPAAVLGPATTASTAAAPTAAAAAATTSTPTPSRPRQRAETSAARSGDGQGISRVTPILVLAMEIIYSMGAFATLALAESEKSLYLSLTSMLVIEVAQVALHVKVRQAVKHVVSDSSAVESLLCDDERLSQWLLFQELGEKVGMFMALGFLCIDFALGRELPAGTLPSGNPAADLQQQQQLLYRALPMLLLQLAGDMLKDLAGQAAGLTPSARWDRRAVLRPLGAMTAISACLVASGLVQGGLALGTA